MVNLKKQLDDIKQINENGVEFWYARDLMSVLGYKRWNNFNNAIERAKKSCKTSKIKVCEHFRGVAKTLPMPHNATKQIEDYMLTRYACYLIAQNGDPRKEAIAFAQAYFSIQTRRQEIKEIEEQQLIKDEERLKVRQEAKESDKYFSTVMYENGVTQHWQIGTVKSNGDKSLFTYKTKDMKKCLGISNKRPLDDFLQPFLVSFRNGCKQLTAYNIEINNLNGMNDINQEYCKNNKAIRNMLLDQGITPESLPAAEDTKKVVQRVNAQRIANCKHLESKK